MLKLNKAGDALFENPLFTAWIKYADDFRLIHRETTLQTMTTLMKHYDDDALAKMIMAAAEVPGTKSIAKRLHAELLRGWLLRKETPDDIYLALKLNKAKDKLLESPLFHVWAKYMLYYNEIGHKTKYDMITTLTYRYGGAKELSTMLMASMKEPSAKTIATELQDLQIARWLSKRKSPAQVSTYLGAEGAAADDVSSTLYKKYATSYNEKYR